MRLVHYAMVISLKDRSAIGAVLLTRWSHAHFIGIVVLVTATMGFVLQDVWTIPTARAECAVYRSGRGEFAWPSLFLQWLDARTIAHVLTA